MTDRKHLTVTQDNRTLLSGNITDVDFASYDMKLRLCLEGMISTHILRSEIVEIRVRSEGKEYKFIFEDK